MVQLVTLAEYAAARSPDPEKPLDPEKLRRTLKRHKTLPEPVGERGGEPLFDPQALDEARGIVPGWVTLAEYAAKHGLSPRTLERWPREHADIWPQPGPKRDRKATFPEEGLDRVRRRVQNVPDPVGSPEDMLTWEGVCAYLAPCTPESTMRYRRSSGLWEPGEVGADRVERWRRGRVDELQAGFWLRGKAGEGKRSG
ncbi:hypothetical protein HNR23_002268 [Nocardiopsis mwathae]|uniref:DNA-binding protein n=1 Tax=Nocardiopsis mwathae TaxID=1472723 RepID=A0A7W9YHE8_9ACTN|nr:hypothetical protein [Nocardiopsis mwathae]MBB6172208.1 hypothetical protein [Nocardiopsis mwathae]